MLYFLETKASEQRALLCQWVEYFYESGKKIQIPADSTMAAQHLDQMLWSFSQSSFIPHRILSSAESPPGGEPVVITVGEVRLPGWDVLICDAGVRPELMMEYPIVFHFILLDDQERRNESRMLWQQGRELGIELQHIPYAANHPKSGWPQRMQAGASS
jgi:DNA polymerase III subunit chi